MKLKLFLVLALCFILIGCANQKDPLIKENMIEVEVKEMYDDKILVDSKERGEMLILISDQTVFTKGDFKSIEKGEMIYILMDDIMMPSLPPQVKALEVYAKE